MLLEQPESLVVIFQIIILGWLLLLTVRITRSVRHYKKITTGVSGTSLDSVLEKIITEQGKVVEDIKKIKGQLLLLDRKALQNIQKVGLLRFSPYSNTGGNQSFSLALLNEKDNGVVLLSLHSREGTRIYVKPVHNGKSEYELSKEEKRAIEEAVKKSI